MFAADFEGDEYSYMNPADKNCCCSSSTRGAVRVSTTRRRGDTPVARARVCRATFGFVGEEDVPLPSAVLSLNCPADPPTRGPGGLCVKLRSID